MKIIKNNVQQVHKKTTTNYITLPRTLVLAVKALPLTPTQISHSFKFLGIVLRNLYQDNLDLSSFTDKPQPYLIKAFSNKYNQWLTVLIDNNIVLRSNYYSKENHVCYSYTINPLYFLYYLSSNLSNSLDTNTSILCIDKQAEPLLTVEYKDIIKLNIEFNRELKLFENDVNQLNINVHRLQKIANKIVEDLSIDDFVVNEKIDDIIVKITESNNKDYFIKRDNAIIKAKESGKSLIQDGRRFLIENEEIFIDNKKKFIHISYINSIKRLEYKSHYANRNPTNKRLDTNFTNMASVMVDDICKENNLMQIDLKNSQFTILSHLLKDELDSDDYSHFEALSVSGWLYDYVAKELGLGGRKQGKNVMFETLFSSRKNNTSSKLKLKKIFPTVIKWIDNYKKENGDDNFSIMLQRQESEMFIDGLLRLIKKEKSSLFCLTKHDSLIIKDEDYDRIMTITTSYFSSIGLKYSLSVTKPTDIKDYLLEDLKKEVPPIELPAEINASLGRISPNEVVDLYELLPELGFSTKESVAVILEMNSSNVTFGSFIRLVGKMKREQKYNDYTGVRISNEILSTLRRTLA